MQSSLFRSVALLLLLLSVGEAAAASDSVADALFEMRTLEHHEAVGTLYTWCTEDASCDRAYHLNDFVDDPVHRRQIFAFFFASWIDDFDQRKLDMCSYIERKYGFSHSRVTGLDGETIRRHWLYFLRVAAHDNERVHCGINEQLMFSRETMDAYCACINNRNCEDGGNWRSRGSVTSGLTLFVALLVVAHIVVRFFHYAAATAYYYRKIADLGPAGKTN